MYAVAACSENSFLAWEDEHEDSELPTLFDEYQNYISAPRIKVKDVRRWWLEDTQQTLYPNLSKMALDLLSIPAMSAEPERLFSDTKITLQDRRNSAHNAEKQYECSFCGNRFKNKNEAERHQNSLHVRRHSWSCSALSGYDRAFHDCTNRPGEADTCGYCGDEFTRSGRGPGSGALNSGNAPRHATEQDWDGRIRHLQDVHKFRECNSSKKFFRADHFRQHLKHSHASTSGKWTNMLENACMLEEDPTPR
ncbi:uncharacterized protein FPOAC1_013051 [Fusarium poae]|uniref:C2H2-type domain-containing protein n=1 Tax=Fusarium poae TaxID=36050 RepID=A0A1B8A541_FUSPO|nr:uncharacterized protein FPOAC1_013051 [Fusarium poae]KAG8665073.1 hypothetical protein FPOAC1_013051 [Fusarium poae]OBS15589.1 hypothetical protein FPOA_13605 [Fusarium poae]